MDTNLCAYSSFEVFSRPPTEIGLEEVQEHQILPLTAITSSTSTLEFDIPGAGDEYIDLASMRLYLQVKVKTTDGTAVADDKISLIKNWAQSLFRQVDLFFNGTLVTTSSSLYHYGAYVSTLLTFPKAVKDHQLQALEHWEEWKVTAAKKENEALIRLHLPPCQQQRFLLNGINVHLRLLRSSDDFIFKRQDATDTKKYTLSIDKCSLFVKKVTPSPTLLLDHARELGKMNAIYPIERISPKFFTLGSGLRDFDLNNVCQGQLPTRIVVGLVSSKDFSGDLKTDPYKFQHFNLTSISLNCSGKVIPAAPLELDYSKGFCRRAYYQLLDATEGPCADAESVGISLEDYTSNGYCLYGFTLSHTLTGPNESVPPRENGYVNAKLKFENALAENVCAIFFIEYNNILEVDSARNIYMDFAA
jgi:hypothetical protein